MLAALNWFYLLGALVTAEGQNQDTSMKCVPIDDCPILYNILNKSSGGITFGNLLSLTYCGFDGLSPKVWCTTFEEPVKITPATPAITTTKPLNLDPTAEQDDTPLVAFPPVPEKRDFIPRHPELPTVQECTVDEDSADKIHGGEAAGLGEFPWLAVLKFEDLCGAMLITRRHVLTAAHCIPFEDKTKWPTSVILGEYDTESEKDCQRVGTFIECADPIVDVEIAHITVHPGWTDQPKDRRFYDDIAIIELKEKVNFTRYIKPLCLPAYNYEINPTRSFTVAGWGLTNWRHNDSISDVPQFVNLPPFSRRECSKVYIKRRLSKKQICAGGVRGKDSCKGDSGGPLMSFDFERFVFVAAGIVSKGPRECGTSGVPGIYTYVPEYLDWILANLDPK